MYPFGGRARQTEPGGPGRTAGVDPDDKTCEIFALVAMVSTGGYLVTAQAAEESQALYWSRQELMEFVTQSTADGIERDAGDGRTVREIQERLRQVTTERVEQRLAHTLIRLAAESGRKSMKGP